MAGGQDRLALVLLVELPVGPAVQRERSGVHEPPYKQQHRPNTHTYITRKTHMDNNKTYPNRLMKQSQ